MNQVLQYLELGVFILSLVTGIAAVVARAWLYLDHGRPDARLDWLQRAVALGALTVGAGEDLLKTVPGAPVDQKIAEDIAHRASQYLKDHGIAASLSPETVRLILNDLRTPSKDAIGFQANKS